MRRDARRSIERIKAAAVQVFCTQGLGASHEAIAREADVAIGTVYRHFPDREKLIDALFEAELDNVVASLQGALQAEDPWDGIVQLYERVIITSSKNLSLKQLLDGRYFGTAREQRIRHRVAPIAEAVFERASKSGALREGVSPTDFPVTILMLGTLLDLPGGHSQDAWRRYLAIVLDGLRSDGSGRAPLPIGIVLEEGGQALEQA